MRKRYRVARPGELLKFKLSQGRVTLGSYTTEDPKDQAFLDNFVKSGVLLCDVLPEDPKPAPEPEKVLPEELAPKKAIRSRRRPAKADQPSEPVRARESDGKFKGDDPATEDVNEAWEPPKATKARTTRKRTPRRKPAPKKSEE